MYSQTSWVVDGAKARRLTFVVVALALCLVLAVRPAPSVYADNDTGRYLFDFHNYCADPLANLLDTSAHSVGGGPAWVGYHVLILPVCAIPMDAVFLMLTAGLLPLGLVLFTPWQRGSVVVAVALVASVYGFTLMSDALRQGASLFFVLGALDARRAILLRLLFAVIAMAVHSSAALVLPVMLFSIGSAFGPGRPAWLAAWSLVAALAGVAAMQLGGAGFGDGLVSRATSLAATYAVEDNALFSVFMALPVLGIVAIRWVTAREHLSIEEVAGGVGYLVAIALAAVFFPYIVYRVALSGAIVQVALLLNSDDVGRVSGPLVSVLLAGQMLVFVSLSGNVASTLMGEP